MWNQGIKNLSGTHFRDVKNEKNSIQETGAIRK